MSASLCDVSRPESTFSESRGDHPCVTIFLFLFELPKDSINLHDKVGNERFFCVFTCFSNTLIFQILWREDGGWAADGHSNFTDSASDASLWCACLLVASFWVDGVRSGSCSLASTTRGSYLNAFALASILQILLFRIGIICRL